MIVPPDILGQVKRQALFPDAPFGSQLALQISPEAFQAIDMVSGPVAVLAFAVFHDPMDIALGCNPGIASPGIGADDRAVLDLFADEGQKGLGPDIGYDLCPDLATPAEDTEDWGLAGSSSSLGGFGALGSSLVLPLATQVGFVHLYDAAEDFWDIVRHEASH